MKCRMPSARTRSARWPNRLPISARPPWIGRQLAANPRKQQAEVQRLEKEAAERQAAEDAERVRVIEALTTGLENLSSGNLAYRINATFAPAYEKLRTEFNSAVGSLSETIDEISSTTEAVRLASSEIGSASDDLSKRTEQQAASLEETAAALDEITSTVKSSSQRAEEASDMVGTAKAGAEKSGAKSSRTPSRRWSGSRNRPSRSARSSR
jgi:methyl-accepting chemotaxis protein